MSNKRSNNEIMLIERLDRILKEEFIGMRKDTYANLSDRVYINKLIDLLIVREKYNDLLSLAKYMVNPPLEKIFNAIIESNDAENIYFCAFIKDAPINELADAIIKTGNIDYIFLFLTTVPNAPTVKLIEYILNSFNRDYRLLNCNCNYIYEIAKKVPNAPIDKLADAIITANNPSYIIDFAANIEGAPIEELANAIIKIDCNYYIYEFTKRLQDNNKVPFDKLVNSIIEIGDAEYIYKFAKDIKHAPINELADAVIKTGNAEYIRLFARDIPKAPIRKLADGLIKTGSASDIYLFARFVDNAPIARLVDGICETRDSYHIIEFARWVENLSKTSINKLANAIIKYHNSDAIYLFAMQINSAPINKLCNALCKKLSSYMPSEIILSNEARSCIKYLILFAEKVQNNTVDKIADSIIKTQDADSILQLAVTLKGQYIDNLADAICKYGMPRHLYSFADKVAKTPTEKLRISKKLGIQLSKTKDAKTIYEYAKNIEGAPIHELAKEIIATCDIQYIHEFALKITMDSETFKLFLEYYKDKYPRAYFELAVFYELFFEK